MSYRVFKILVLHGHGQSADIIKPKTRYIRQLLQSLSQEIEFQFEYLSAPHAAYPDTDAPNDQRVWGIGEPQTDRIQGLENSIAVILETLNCSEQPFCGIIGFSSGAAMAAIVTSLLEKRKPICGIPYQTYTILKFQRQFFIRLVFGMAQSLLLRPRFLLATVSIQDFFTLKAVIMYRKQKKLWHSKPRC
ncbi:hypothetical protein N7493_002270 [Penicillium malachiteum]|uniref:Serine hydrolase domain-containing protein n=1 Tax=Penicillium malachiteum TaxID=1324776 RepID=A0AAD6HSL5_9EURO|nr:hypothetical protein N7493_002270 [Penicillium malachiteum]